MRHFLRFAPMLMLTGCSGKWVVPWQDAEILRIDMLGVTLSWPLIAVAGAIGVLALWIRAKVRKDDK